MKHPFRILAFSLTMFIAPLAGADQAEPFSATFSHPAMSTLFEFTLYSRPGDTHEAQLQRIADQAFAAVDHLESQLSVWISGSPVSYINHQAGKGPTPAPDVVIDIIESSRRQYDATHGAFDISVGPVLELFGFYAKEGRSPSEAEIEQARALVGMDKVVTDSRNRTVELVAPGMRIDFGGIGKGYALDVAAEVLKSNGITRALLKASTSSILAIGAPVGQDHWTVSLENPYNPAEALEELPLADASFSASGCYGDKPTDDQGRRYCHIVDPRTGRPVEGVLATAIVTKESAAAADALTTGFLVMGKAGIEAYCKERPGVLAVFVGVPDAGQPVAEKFQF